MTAQKPMSNMSRTVTALLASVLLAIFVLALAALGSSHGSDSRFPDLIMQFFFTPFSSRYFAGNLVADAVPLMIAGLGILIAFKSRNFNLGGEGQLYAGALAATVVALACQDHVSPASSASVAGMSIAAGILTGALLGAFSGVL
ncbi:MAG: hypothetical protein N3A02_04630, partial [Rectinema sp.]|nr:hypothetical protein [Rectinema sp.]